MKKTILTILLFGIMLFGISGCKTSNDFNVGGVSNIKTSNNDVSLSIKDQTLKNTGATLILTNDSDKLLYYDAIYEIEIKKDDEWHKINVEIDFDLPLFQVEHNSNKEIELNWEHGYGKLAPGEYRIIKEVYFEGYDTQESKFYVSAEFTIE